MPLLLVSFRVGQNREKIPESGPGSGPGIPGFFLYSGPGFAA